VRKIAKSELPRKEALWNAVEQAWNGLDQEMIDQLVADLQRRCQLVQQGRGKSISQFLVIT
jgi:hypothetical protein